MRSSPVRAYYWFSLYNVISFTFLAGNIMTLYALRFNASAVAIGMIAASYQSNLLFALLGRKIVPRVGAVKTFGYGWLIRYAIMVPVILTAIPAIRAHASLVLALITVCAYGFNIGKGIALAGMKPTVGEIAPGGQLGKVISTNHLINNAGGIATGLTIALLLGPQSPISRYAILLGIGVAAGLMAAWYVLRLPEPRAAAAGFSGRFTDGIRRAVAHGPFRRFVAALSLAGFGSAMAQAFVIVFFKKVYGYADGTVVFFTVAGSVGGSVMALISRAVTDKIGTKVLFFTFTGLVAVVCLTIALAPTLGGALAVVFPAVIYFFFVMGEFGIFTTTEIYFYSITEAEHRLDLGIVAGLFRGSAGLAGSFVGGLALSALQRAYPAGSSRPFTIYFLMVAAIMSAALTQIARLSTAGGLSIRQAMRLLFRRRGPRGCRSRSLP